MKVCLTGFFFKIIFFLFLKYLKLKLRTFRNSIITFSSNKFLHNRYYFFISRANKLNFRAKKNDLNALNKKFKYIFITQLKLNNSFIDSINYNFFPILKKYFFF